MCALSVPYDLTQLAEVAKNRVWTGQTRSTLLQWHWHLDLEEANLTHAGREASFSQTTYTVVPIRSLQRPRHQSSSVTWLCSLESDTQNHPPVPQIVCKFGPASRAGRDELRATIKGEFQWYNKLQALQGEYIPIVHGFYSGNTEAGQVDCLLLSYEGSPVKGSVEHCPKDIQHHLMQGIIKMHKLGVLKHMDWREARKDVVIKDVRRAMVVGFREAEKHQCPYDESRYTLRMFTPDPDLHTEVLCEDIYLLLKDWLIWIYVDYWDENYPRLPREWGFADVDEMVPEIVRLWTPVSHFTPEEARKFAQKLSHGVFRWMRHRTKQDLEVPSPKLNPTLMLQSSSAGVTRMQLTCQEILDELQTADQQS